MNTNRRRFLTHSAAAAAAMAVLRPGLAAGEKVGIEPEVGNDGLFHQPWFIRSFNDLAEDHAELTAKNRTLAVIFEQRGCPYCRELHRVNFRRREIVDYIKKNFGFLQLDLWGSREVTDFDGKKMEERALARRWGVIFTPTVVFFPRDVAAVKGKPGSETQAAKMPGYFKPFHFMSMLEYVHDGHYKNEHFQKFLQARMERLRAQGLNPDVW